MSGHVRDLGKTKAGQPVYQARWRHPEDPRVRRERRFKALRDDRQSRHVARKRAAGWIAQQDADAGTADWLDPRDARRAFSEAVDSWKRSRSWEELEPKTRVGYESILRRRVVPAFGDRRLSHITHDDVQAFVDGVKRANGEPLAPNTVLRIYNVLRRVFRHAKKAQMLKVNPCEDIDLPSKGRRPPMRYLEPGEVKQLADAVPEHYRTAVYVAAWCGLRAGELWALRRSDIDLLRGTLRVDEAIKEVTAEQTTDAPSEQLLTPSLAIGPPKSAASNRTFTMPEPIVRLLREHLSRPLPGGDGPEAFVFTTPSGLPIRHGMFYSRVFRGAIAGRQDRKGNVIIPALWPEGHRLHGLRWHDLRHTCASLSLAVTESLHVVKERLGHEDIQTTVNIYGHLVPSVDKAVADGLGRLFDAAEKQDRTRMSERLD